MKSEQRHVNKAAKAVAENVKEETRESFDNLTSNILQEGALPKDALGVDDVIIEGIYGQAYRLYNTGKYREAGQLFRLLVIANSLEPKYAMGLAACFHMLKEYKSAVQAYLYCSVIDPDSPIPHYHASDCYLQMKDKVSAVIALEMAVKFAGEKPEFKTLKDRALLTISGLKKDLKEANT